MKGFELNVEFFPESSMKSIYSVLKYINSELGIHKFLKHMITLHVHFLR